MEAEAIGRDVKGLSLTVVVKLFLDLGRGRAHQAREKAGLLALSRAGTPA